MPLTLRTTKSNKKAITAVFTNGRRRFELEAGPEDLGDDGEDRCSCCSADRFFSLGLFTKASEVTDDGNGLRDEGLIFFFFLLGFKL